MKRDDGSLRQYARMLWVVVFVFQLLLVLVLGIGAQMAIPFFTTVLMVLALGVTWPVMAKREIPWRLVTLVVAALALAATLALAAVFYAGPGQPGWQRTLTYTTWAIGTIASLAVSVLMFSRRDNQGTPTAT